MNITEVRVHYVDQAQVRAYVNIVFDNCFAVNEIGIIQTPTGFMVAMPSEKQKNGDYEDLAFPINAVTRKMIEDAVIGEYVKPARESLRQVG